MSEKGKPIYLDYQATTPLDPRVLEAMMPFLTEKFGNPHSSTHRYGWEADVALDVAREQCSDLIGAEKEEIIFTSGATEANNLAIKGVMRAWKHRKPHLITAVTEHKCVLESCRAVEAEGCDVTYLPVKQDGLIDLADLEAAITDRTALVSLMAVNNEIGVIQPLREIGRLVRAKGVLFHTDAAQAFGKIDLDVEDMAIDLMSISGHKIYGPKGVGALYRRGDRRVAMVPTMSGGGQEGGYRSGTQAPALVAGLGAAARLASREWTHEETRIKRLMADFLSGIKQIHPDTIVNGSLDRRWWGNLNLTFPGIDGDMLLAETRGIAVSSGAACASAVSGPSYVLQALGVSEKDAKSSIRIGMGRFTTNQEVDTALKILCEAVSKQKERRLL